MLFDVDWIQAGVTRVEANTPEEARRVLTEYPFADDTAVLDVVSVEPVE